MAFTCCDTPDIGKHDVTSDDYCRACGFNTPTTAEVDAMLLDREHAPERCDVEGCWLTKPCRVHFEEGPACSDCDVPFGCEPGQCVHPCVVREREQP